MNPFAPLGDRDFRLYFVGQVFSMAGSGLHIVALGWYLLDRTGSATSVALVWALGLGSGIVMLPFAGPLADRYPRRTLAIGADLVRFVLVAAMAALAFAGSPSLPALYVLTFVVGLGHSVFWPSITALLQEVIRPEQLTAASGLAEITWQVGNLTGAALGGPILVRFGLGAAFAIDAATYLVSAAALLALHHRPAPAEGRHESGLAMAREGASAATSATMACGMTTAPSPSATMMSSGKTATPPQPIGSCQPTKVSAATDAGAAPPAHQTGSPVAETPARSRNDAVGDERRHAALDMRAERMSPNMPASVTPMRVNHRNDPAGIASIAARVEIGDAQLAGVASPRAPARNAT